MKSMVLLSAATIMSLVAPSPVFAQASSDETELASGTGDIIVTARRRDESLSKVPVAISVLTGDALAKQGIRSEADLQTAVPGLLIQQGGSSNLISFVIRGQTIDQYTASPPAILAYVNDFQIDAPVASAFFDIESVQVLKGPQGTLFGRNTTGGAILYTTVKPKDEFGGFVSGRVGNFSQIQVQAAVNLPLSPFASLRVAGNYSEGGGFVRNLGFYDLSGSFVPRNNTLGDNKNRSIRGTLLLEPTDTIRNTVVAQYSRDDGSSIPSTLYSFDPTNVLIQPFLSGFSGPFTGMADFLAFQRQTIRKTYTNNSWRNRSRNYSIINTTEVDLSDNMTLKNIVGWARYNKDNVFDYDGMPWDLFPNREARPSQNNIHNQFSNELQLQGKLGDDALTYVVGLYYANVRDIQNNNFLFYGFIPVSYNTIQRDRSYAAFAQATYNLTEELHLTGGFRYAVDKIDHHQLDNSAYAPNRVPLSPAFELDQKVKSEKPSWTVSLDYQATAELLLYATQRGSWRTGQFNYSAPPITTTGDNGGNLFLPETTRDIEIGAKFNGRLGSMPFAASANVYNQWVSNIQRAVFVLIAGTPSNVTVNVPKAKISGIEANFSIKPSSWLDLGGQISYVNARFTSNRTVVLGNDFAFGPMGFAPELSGAAYVELTKDMGDAGSLQLRGDVFAVSHYFFGNLERTATPGTRLPGYALVNGSLRWNDMLVPGLTASVYVKNAFDRKYYTGGLAPISGIGVNTASPGMPRNFGMELRFNF